MSCLDKTDRLDCDEKLLLLPFNHSVRGMVHLQIGNISNYITYEKHMPLSYQFICRCILFLEASLIMQQILGELLQTTTWKVKKECEVACHWQKQQMYEGFIKCTFMAIVLLLALKLILDWNINLTNTVSYNLTQCEWFSR